MTERGFLQRILLLAFGIRLGVVFLFWATDAIFLLRLSPDSERYHREGLIIMEEMANGNFNWLNWIDNGWFQFTGLAYYLVGPYPMVIQLINISVSTFTVYLGYKLAWEISENDFLARNTALFMALFPSFVYWSALMLKDPTAIMSMTLLVYSTVLLRERLSLKAMMGVVIGLLIFLGIRDYMFFMTLAFVGISLLFFTKNNETTYLRSMLFLLFIAIIPKLFGMGYFAIDYMMNSIYFDLEYLNHLRIAMGDHGSGAFFAADEVTTWGGSIWDNIVGVVVGLYYFFFVIDVTNLGSVRQLMALPEVLLLIVLFPHFVRGVKRMWRARRDTFPLFVFLIGVMAVLIAGTTNAGALFRWKMQVMPLLVIFMLVGVAVHQNNIFYRVLERLTR